MCMVSFFFYARQKFNRQINLYIYERKAYTVDGKQDDDSVFLMKVIPGTCSLNFISTFLLLPTQLCDGWHFTHQW